VKAANNDVLRRMRYFFDLSDSKIIGIFGNAEMTTDRESVSQWLNKEQDAGIR